MFAKKSRDKVDWSDLRILLALARAGSLSAAARLLGVNHSTVYRRLSGLEAQLGLVLFERQGGRYGPTAEGEDFVATAERVETEVEGLERRLSGRGNQPRGLVRMTAPSDLANRLVLPLIADFHKLYPDIKVELVVGSSMLDLSRREAEIALRPTDSPPETLVGRRLGLVNGAIYAHRDTAVPDESQGKFDSIPYLDWLCSQPWVGWESGNRENVFSRWLNQHIPEDAMVLRSNSMVSQVNAVECGLGLALLPCVVGDECPAARRVGPVLDELATNLWLLTHPDLRQSARIRVLLDFLYGEIRKQRTRLEGRTTDL